MSAATLRGRPVESLKGWEPVAHLTPEQLALAELMSEMSETAICAMWDRSLSVWAWEIAQGHHRDGWHHLSAEDVEQCRVQLLRLSEACGGWLVWEEPVVSNSIRWVPMAEWVNR